MKIDINDLKPGMYMCKIIQDNVVIESHMLIKL